MKAPLQVSDLEYLHDQVIPFFNEKWKEGDENERYKKGKHFDEDQEKKIHSQNRQVYSMAVMTTKINNIRAHQMQARTQFDVKANVDPADEIKAELAKLMLRDDERISKFRYIESEVFDSGLSVKYGAGEAYVDYSSLYPKIKFRKIDYKNVVWDTNSREYDLSDALFVATLDRMYRFQLKQEHPEFEGTEDDENWGREKSSYYVSLNKNGNTDLDIISKITHYQKVAKRCFYVVHPDPLGLFGEGIYTEKFDSKKKAEEKLREINIPYLMEGMDFYGTVEGKDEIGYDKYVFADGQLLDYEVTDLPSPPPKIYRCFHFEDDFWSFMDMLKSPQKFMDRLFAQIDYSFGTDIKNVYQLNVNALADGMTFEGAKKIIEQTGGVVPSNSSEAILQAVKSQGINPQWLQVASIMQAFIEDFAGGRSFQGLAEGSQESGKAINLKKQQGVMIALLMLDNLARWKQQMGEFALYLHEKHDSGERQIKVQGDELTPEMLQLLQSNGITTPSQTEDSVYVKLGIDFLKDAELELTVTEAALTESEKDAQYMQLVEWGRMNPQLAMLPAFNMILLEYNTSIPHKLKKQLIAELQGERQRLEQSEQEERNINKAKILQDGMIAQMQINRSNNEPSGKSSSN